MTRFIPNFITLLNLLCGVFAVFMAIHGHWETAAYLIFFGALFDFADGFAARALKAYSEIGKQLDSLADLISFGFAPAAIWSNMMYSLKFASTNQSFFNMSLINQIIVMSPFILVAFAALRLAKFNVDTRQSENFLGLTTTATGIFTASFVLLLKSPSATALQNILSPTFIIIAIAIFSSLLVSEIPMFSLKFKTYGWQGNAPRYTLLIAGLILIGILGWGGISILILLYILFSIVANMTQKN
ncbi:CDP-diacylglycerol--serine O-phosphatidyltransferase [Breznakibacter xylanolyticus]|uniref:CDP-diacylglycerol--serine O-phosphatidyltransferase n=1 Tax=Breznakibacter xylanolyticus TaxID=990 RepID=A0A2W7NCM6_9BACT|nr:CDP-alcohol phosphatidyltransferase family protein [Breznakibacter xylanolyticus]PZX17373.1 CDP-diacylglycerol--serine O-phosphatidyltransferase [Breznakibacter xylanolyticus]